jgi:acyl carrier protein
MNDTEVLTIIRTALGEVAPTRKEEFAKATLDTKIEDLALDSIATMEMVSAIEDRLETTFEEAELARVQKLADLAKLMRASAN